MILRIYSKEITKDRRDLGIHLFTTAFTVIPLKLVNNIQIARAGEMPQQVKNTDD